MSAKNRGPRPKPDLHSELLTDLRNAFTWRGDRPDPALSADITGWWADPSILARLDDVFARYYAPHPDSDGLEVFDE